MEYDGSMMFDEYPDRRMMEHLCGKIEREMEAEDAREDGGLARIMEGGCGFRDLIGVLLFNEMYRRRCRHRRCHWIR